jgi:hypothetical protein
MAVEYAADEEPPASDDPGGRTTVDPVGRPARPDAAEARPDQLTRFDVPAADTGGRRPGRPAPWRAVLGTRPPESPTEPSGDLGGPTGPAGRPALASIRNVLIVAGSVLMVLVVLDGIAWASSGDDGKPANKHASAPPPSTPSRSASATPPSPSAKPSTGLPAGFHTHDDGSGYSIPVPDGWTGPESKQGGDYFYAPGRATYLQVDQTDSPGASAIGDWRHNENGGRAFPGYKRIKIEPTGDHPPVPDTGSGDRSADWEFTYDAGGRRVHVLNRGFVANGHGYAILLRAPQDAWDATFTKLQPVYRLFTPAEA